MERPLFAADSIVKSFGRRTVLKCASVWGYAGRVTVAFGRNGAGKSTLLKVGAGVLRADSGVVHFRGKTYQRPRLHRLAQSGLFYLPARGLLSPRWAVQDHLDAVSWRFETERGLLSELSVSGLVERRPHEMSGGERRRADLAIAWMRKPICLLADEPLAGIHPRDAEMIGSALVAMARSGCAVVVTGHEVPHLMRIADEVVWVTAGTTHGLGTPATASAHDQFRREYLGPTATS